MTDHELSAAIADVVQSVYGPTSWLCVGDNESQYVLEYDPEDKQWLVGHTDDYGWCTTCILPRWAGAILFYELGRRAVGMALYDGHPSVEVRAKLEALLK